jgi:RimJ/RimL family protein N-acetyltransferase
MQTPLRMLPERIRTDRLLLRHQRATDAPLVKEAIDASLSHLQASVGWARYAPFSLETLAERLAASEAAFRSGHEWIYSVFDPSEARVLGGVAAQAAEPALTALVGDGAVEMGYWLRASATAQGYATEATAALVKAAFTHLAATKVVICHDPNNAASGAVPRRLGFRAVGVVPAMVLPGREAADGSPRPATQVWVLDAAARQ